MLERAIRRAQSLPEIAKNHDDLTVATGLEQLIVELEEVMQDFRGPYAREGA